MLKRIAFIVFAALLVFTSVSLVMAQDEESQGSSGASGISLEEDKMIYPDYIVPPNRGGVMPFSGQNHFYSLIFRGNGESILTLRVALTNTNEKEPLKEVTLRVPKIIDPKDLSAYQIFVTPPCVRYDNQTSSTYPYNPRCAEYGEPDYYYYYGNGKYQKAQVEFSGDTLKVKLPQVIAPNKTGSFFVYFRGFGYAKKTLFGAYKYDFESLKVEDQINELKLGISTDSDLFLKGVKGEVDYRQTEASAALKAMPAADAGAVANSQVDRFVSQIGYGQITKTATNLASLESYKVEGLYANSRAKLYGREIVVILGIILVLVLISVFVVRHFLKKSKESGEPVSEKKSTGDNLSNFGVSVGVSFASSLITAGYSIAVYAIANAIGNLVDYQYQAVVMILLIVISFAIYLLLLVGPSVFVGIKRGIGWGVGTFAMTIVWLVILAIIAVLVLFIFRQDSGYPRPLYYGAMEKGLPSAVDSTPVE